MFPLALSKATILQNHSLIITHTINIINMINNYYNSLYIHIGK